MKRLVFRLTGLLIVCFLFCLPALATSLVVVSGRLQGATGVTVGGLLYDVEFVDGTCASVYGACDAAHFPFHTQVDAEAAAVALFTSVFVDEALGNFDSNPALTFGCTSTSECRVVTSFGLINATTHQGALATNRTGVSLPDVVASTNVASTADTTSSAFLVYARWTPSAQSVPEPTSIMLLGVAALALVPFHLNRVLPVLQGRRAKLK